MTRVFIQYKDGNAVSVDTSFGRGPARDMPLEIVGDLIAAFFPNTAPNELGQYTLHLPEGVDVSFLSHDWFADSNKTTLDAGCLLSALNSLGSNSKQPLTIRSLNDTITIDDFMKIALPAPVYVGATPTSNSSGIGWKKPKHLKSWLDFKHNVI